MRNGKAAGALVLALVLAGGTAGAQSRHSGPSVGPSATGPGQPAGKYRIQPLNLHKEALGTEAFASAARARMRNGDCAGALDDFDLALQSSTTDATLNRDRGLCHERLGDPYPAIEDYRAYVTAAPDASDAEGIRQRLQRLEMEVYKHSSESTDSPDEGRPPAASGASSASSTSTAASATVVMGDEPKRDAMEEVEHDHDELSSSMRAGKGFGLAPFFSEQKWFTPNSSIGDSTTWSESVGLQVRYSVNSGSAFFVEAGWQLFNSTSVANISGLTSQLGYELRVPLDYRYNNQFLFGLGLGFEYFVVTPNIVSAPGTSVGIFVPQLKAGWRHMLTTSVGLDLALGFGITGEALATSPYLRGSGSSSPPVEIHAANKGVVWGQRGGGVAGVVGGGADEGPAGGDAAALTGIGLTAYTAVQCVPMPIGWLAVIAPHNADVWSRALHEPGPSWAPISVPLPHADHLAPFLERLGLVGSDDEAGELHEVQLG